MSHVFTPLRELVKGDTFQFVTDSDTIAIPDAVRRSPMLTNAVWQVKEVEDTTPGEPAEFMKIYKVTAEPVFYKASVFFLNYEPGTNTPDVVGVNKIVYTGEEGE